MPKTEKLLSQPEHVAKIRAIMEHSLAGGEFDLMKTIKEPQLTLEQVAYRWMSMTHAERIQAGFPITQRDMALFLRIGTTKMKGLKRQYMNRTFDLVANRFEYKKQPNKSEAAAISDIEKLTLARKVYNDAMAQGATAKDKDLAVRMLGMLIEKSIEVKIGFSADELTRIEQEARRLNREEGFTSGTGAVLPESSLLPKEIR